MSADILPWAVVATKAGGWRVIFSRPLHRADAELTAGALSRYGLPAVVEEVADDAAPGTTIARSAHVRAP